eukprot:3612036-Rhodomonas_salina.3
MVESLRSSSTFRWYDHTLESQNSRWKAGTRSELANTVGCVHEGMRMRAALIALGCRMMRVPV